MDALANDGHAALAVLEGLELEAAVSQAGELLATLLGQDLDTCEDGVFRIARRVAKDRIISTVDPEARHGHKTATRGFDGYKGHVAIDPDSEIITATVVTAGNTGDAASAAGLLAEELATPAAPEGSEVKDAGPAVAEKDTGEGHASPAIEAGEGLEAGGTGDPAALAVYEDAAYGAGALLVELEAAGATVMVKVQPPVAPGGRYTKGCFIIDTGAGTVTCPAKVTVPIRVAKDGGCTAAFGAVCTACPLAEQCTASKAGRTVTVSRYEAELVRARETQKDPACSQEYRAARPKVERKIGHLMRRKHGGRRARVRGRAKADADLSLLAAALNIARLGVLKISHITPAHPARASRTATVPA